MATPGNDGEDIHHSSDPLQNAGACEAQSTSALEYLELIPPGSEFEILRNDHAGRFMTSAVDLSKDYWFLLESPLACWPVVSQREGVVSSGLAASAADELSTQCVESEFRTSPNETVMPWCEACLCCLSAAEGTAREAGREEADACTSETVDERRVRPRITETSPHVRLCSNCVQSGGYVASFLTDDLLFEWRRWQKTKSPESCVGLEAFGRCFAQVANVAQSVRQSAGLDPSRALDAAMQPFDRLEGPPSGALVTLHGTSPAEVSAQLRASNAFCAKLTAALGSADITQKLLSEVSVENLAGRLVLNAAGITIPGAGPGGKPLQAAGIYVLLSTMNHSCSPTARVTASSETGAEISMLTNRDVQAGEALTLAYVPQDWDVAERRQRLRGHWFFECDCWRCEAENCLATALAPA